MTQQAALRADSTRQAAPQREGVLPADAVPFKTWVAVCGACLGAFLAILNIQIVSSSLADIQGAIGAGIDDGGWITTSYLVAEIIVIPISGWLARVFSLRYYLLTNIALFLIFTVGCAFTSNLGEMIVVRALQGFSGGVLIPLAFSIIMTRLPPSKHPTGLAIYSVSAVFAPAIGPVIGGYCNENFGWQAVFMVNVLPGLLMFGLLWFSLDSDPPQLKLLRQGDWSGILFMAVGLGCLETFLEEGEKDDWFGSTFIARLAIISTVSLLAFLVLQLVKKNHLLEIRLLLRRNFSLATIANFVFGFSMFGWIFVVPLYLARLQGYNAQQIGGVLIWIGLPQLAILPFIPKLMKYVDSRRIVGVGFTLFIGGSLLALNFSDDFSGPQFIWSSVVRALGQSLVMAPLSAIAIAGIEREYAPSASALFNMIRNLGGAIGIAALQTFLTIREQYHSDIITSQVSLLNSETRRRLAILQDRFMAHGVTDTALAHHEAVVAIGRIVRRQASMLAYSDTIIFQSVLLGIGLLSVLGLKKAAPATSGRQGR
ncbi:MDR family MFS transporter [Novacetimonas pomaceti]|uniref:EmrB/QacA family drug resistance transporter n=1 Tax=Novacetimonas pomaceti TaxID=2021998 RepID=A0ABX5P4D5_9PROT|nr:MDR family MFS transporter [Novacetimonas pomaceti]PYD48605.1 EmrB/QacA family drug resistance transporter [Novacetimonas pomaceti]